MTRRKAVGDHILLRISVFFSQLANSYSKATEECLLVHCGDPASPRFPWGAYDGAPGLGAFYGIRSSDQRRCPRAMFATLAYRLPGDGLPDLGNERPVQTEPSQRQRTAVSSVTAL